MKKRVLTAERITAYVRYLRGEERAPGTIEKYLHDVRTRSVFWAGRR